MPESKTIEIDEIVTPEKSGGGDPQGRADRSRSAAGGTTTGGAGSPEFGPENPFANFHKTLPWKARLTIRMTQWFMLLRSKSWGMLILVPLIILSVLLAIPLIAIAIVVITLRSVFFPRRG
jgi:hypothetical protein